MKKIIALLLALSMLFALTACGGNDESTPTGESTGETTSTTESTNNTTDGNEDSTQGTTEGTTGSDTTDTSEPSTTTSTTTTPPATEAPHTHSYSSKVTTAATCGKEGVKTFTCSCGHSYTEKIAATSQHSWKDATCTAPAKCSCGATQGSTKEHIPVLSSANAIVCTMCKIPLGPTEGIMYYISSDRTYAEVGGYSGTAKNILIAEEYNGLPVKVICSEAFSGNRIESVYIPKTITRIESGSFDYGLSAIYISDITAWCNLDFGSGSVGRRNPLCYANNLYLNGKLVEDIVLPDGIKTVKSEVFVGCTSLKSISLPTSVTTIEFNAFSGCTNLRSITIPQSVVAIGTNAFSGCPGIEVVDGVGYVDGWAVSYSGSATSLKLREGTVGIAEDVFYDIGKLRTVVLPEGLLYIGRGAFQSCANLSAINIPEGVKSIGISAFNCCDKLAQIIIPNSVTYLGDQALSAKSLSSVVLSKNVTEIRDWTFMECPYLATIYYLGNAHDFSRLQVGHSGNNMFLSATKYYYSSEKPTDNGLYWHYVNGVPTKWE